MDRRSFGKISPQKGFTILEIMIVVVIVGVLASLALPRYFKFIETTRSIEAIRILQMIRKDLEMCYAVNPSSPNCGNAANMATFQNYFTGVNSHFTLASLGTGPGNPPIYTIVARRTSHELSVVDPGGAWSCGPSSGGSGLGSEIVLCQMPAVGLEIAGSGFYSSIKF